MEDLVGREFGPYRIVAALGEGGMASVYKAYQPAVDRHVAIKVLPRHFASDPHYLSRFQNEARILARLQHPHILPIFDFGESEGYTFLAMPFVDGGTLAETCRGPVALAVAERIISQISDALTYAHGKGVVHRDLKPSNILIDESGNCLVADFGIAHLASDATRLTMTGTVIGTPDYMSPEQAAGTDVGPWSDVYSVGIILYEILTGRVPFKADTPLAVALQHLTAPLPSPRTFNPALTPAVEAVVLKALARSKDDRYASTQELAAAFTATVGLVAIPRSAMADGWGADFNAATIKLPAAEPRHTESAGSSESSDSAKPNRDAPRVRGRRRYLVAAISVAAAIAVAVVGYVWTARQPPPAPVVEFRGEAPSTPATVAAPLQAPPAPRAVPPSAVQARPVETPLPTQPSAAERRASNPPTTARPGNKPDPPLGLPGQLKPSEYDKAIAQYGRNCNAGRLPGCVNLGIMSMNGYGTEKDENRAVALFRRACDGGYLLGCAHLGGMYLNGRGVLRDANKAAALFQQACDGGNAFGCTRLDTLRKNRRASK